MGGFPTRSTRTSFGPTMENEKPVTNPKREPDASMVNQALWNIAGCGRTVPLAVLRCSVSGSAVTVEDQWLAWDSPDALGKITFSYEGKGHYKFTFAATYPDELGNAITLQLKGGSAAECNQYGDEGTHTGIDNQGTLTDSTKTWTPSEWIGSYIWNITDNSRGPVTANTSDTLDATLAGGGNDWDTDDKYLIVGATLKYGRVFMSAANIGWVQFHYIASGTAIPGEAAEFIMELW